ncbi:MAG TPA: protein kinase [Vicinamibacterales bacterium]|nr:protein kinase [Vicinamibacterales bacterium]
MTDAAGGRFVGRTISHYRVVAPLGVGGMGVVYRGEDTRLGRPVAIKFVADDFANDAQAVARLRAEARAASALNHPNICTIYDVGTEEGQPFIVMELMEGQTLRERLTRSRLKTHELVDIGIQIADALQGAHSAGIMHRDIKPANIFLLTGRGHVKILDFGLAKLTDTPRGSDSVTLGSADLTAAGTTLGTVSYMSPEQATGEDLDGRTDIFSLGVVLYECATGRQPFEGKTHAVILEAILNRSPAPPTALNPDLPARLQEVIATCLEKDRELRYQSAADLRADLKRVRRDLESGRAPVTQTATIPISTVSGPTTIASTRASNATVTAAAASEVAQPPRSGGRTALWAIAGLVLLAALVGGAYALRPDTRPSTPAATASTPPNGGTASNSAEAVQERLALARSSLAAGNYRAAQVYAAEVLGLDANQADALRIRQEAASALARFDASLATARERLGAGDLQGASRALTTARDLDPTNPAVYELASMLAGRVPGAVAVAPPRAARPEPPAPRPSAAAPPAVASLPAGPARGTAAPTASTSSPEPPPPAPAAAAPPIVATTPPPALPEPVPAPASARPPAPAPAAAPPASDARGAAPTPARPPASDDDAAVRRVVSTYAKAIEGKDVALFRSVKPNITREEERRLQDGFRAVTSQQVHLTIGSVDLRDQEATVVAQRRDLIEAGGRRQTVDSRQTFRLTRTPAGWVITDIR